MRPTVYCCFLALCLLHCFHLQAQNNRFTKVFYDSKYETSRTSSRAAVTIDKGLLLAGDSLLLRIDSKGTKVWSKTYRIANSSIAIRDLVTLDDGSFLAVGFTTNLQDQKQSSLLLKINAIGTVIWAKSLTFGTIQNRLLTLSKTFDQHVVVLGNTMENKPLYAKMIVAKITTDGEVIWSKLYTGLNQQNFGYAIQQKNDSSYVITGQVAECTPCNYYAFLSNVSDIGQPIWAKKYSFLQKSFDLGIGLSVEPDKIVMLMNRALVQTDPVGKIKHVLVANALSFNYYDVQLNTRLLRTSDGGYVIPKGNPFASSLLKTNKFGDILWSRRLRLNPTDVHETAPNTLKIVGTGPMMGVAPPEDVALPHIGVIETDSLGSENDCTQPRSEQPLVDSILSSVLIFTDEFLGNLIPVSIVSSNIDLQELDQCVDFVGKTSDLPSFVQISVAPNPTSGSTTILTEPRITRATVSVYDLNGRKMLQMNDDQYTGEIDLSGLHRGVYLLRITTDAHVGTVKLIKED